MHVAKVVDLVGVVSVLKTSVLPNGNQLSIHENEMFGGTRYYR